MFLLMQYATVELAALTNKAEDYIFLELSRLVAILQSRHDKLSLSTNEVFTKPSYPGFPCY